MNALIVGYGSAGRRHKETLKSVAPWTKIKTVDVNGQADYIDIGDAISEREWDIVVVSTPPKFHLSQVRVALDYGANVLCEKPLCDIGQLDEAIDLSKHPLADSVMVAYNYRFNKSLRDMKPLGTDAKSAKKWWLMYCSQHRPTLPEWGILIDNLSHDIDIVRWKSCQSLGVTYTSHTKSDDSEKWVIRGTMSDGCIFEISDSVDTKNDIERRAVLSTPNGWTNISANSGMFLGMWDRFLENISRGNKQEPSIADAIETQKVLEDAYERSR